MPEPLPTHPLTGLTAIGWRKARGGEDDRRPIWPILGASDDDTGTGTGTGEETEADTDGGEQDDDAPIEGQDALGDAGKRALDKMKADLKAEKTRRKAVEADLAAAKAAAGQQTKTDQEPDLEQLRAQALETARAETLTERALDRLETRAAKRFNDPADARAHLGPRIAEFLDGGQIDTAAIDEALTELLEAKPYLAASAAPAKPRFEGTGDGGARKGGTGPAQLTESDLKKMTSEQIDEAHRKGQFNDLLGKKQ